MYLDRLRTLVSNSTVLNTEEFVGCSKLEIYALEEQLSTALPNAYKEFLIWMGKDAGHILRGSHCFYKDLLFLKKWALDLLSENEFPKSLPNDAFVFFMHQGYQFAFMRISDGDNPKVYYYNETINVDSFSVSYPSFDRFLEDEIVSVISFLQNKTTMS